jgi:hypothetical protein
MQSWGIRPSPGGGVREKVDYALFSPEEDWGSVFCVEDVSTKQKLCKGLPTGA